MADKGFDEWICFVATKVNSASYALHVPVVTGQLQRLPYALVCW